MYEFHRNYTEFFDLSEQDASTRATVQVDFVSNFARFAQQRMNLDKRSTTATCL